MKFTHRAFVLVITPCVLACSSPSDPALATPEERDVRWAALGRACASDSPAWSLPDHLNSPVDSTESNLNTRTAAIARQVPGGWGGSWLSSGRMWIYLVDPSRRDEAVSTLNELGMPTPPDVRVKQGRWSFAGLYDWFRYVNEATASLEGRASSDVQEARNRLEYQVVGESARLAMETVLQGLDLPCFLVTIEVVDEVATSSIPAS